MRLMLYALTIAAIFGTIYLIATAASVLMMLAMLALMLY